MYIQHVDYIDPGTYTLILVYTSLIDPIINRSLHNFNYTRYLFIHVNQGCTCFNSLSFCIDMLYMLISFITHDYIIKLFLTDFIFYTCCK